ncbi:hypothetical protein HPP92_019418 [Vanilla planifolia]|uniref:Uncharacterized protein n=1 Tax=Vanilla planifolia TaxID=51239 RepID=A0A835Q8Y3_VANPL|nr:hypothetical protein HPP92_019418 [Vanilla planifolia]
MASASEAHLLVIPFPSHGHMLPLLDICRLLATRGSLSITIVITPGNLPILSPLLDASPTITPLVLPFPPTPALPPHAENTHQLPRHLFRHLLFALSALLNPILLWCRTNPNPPVAILSDYFTSGWTLPLARALSVPRLCFSPSPAFFFSAVQHLWRLMPPRDDPNLIVRFPSLPGSPTFPLAHLSNLFRSYVEGDLVSEFLKDNFLSDAQSWGLVVNTFSELEGEYLDFLRAETRCDRVWAVGPLAAVAVKRRWGFTEKEELMAWLDNCEEGSVVYVCFGSQAMLSEAQAVAIAGALARSGVRFLWCVREGTVVPGGTDGRGKVVIGWAPQMELLRHAAVGWFLTHCGWNSVSEAISAGVAMLTWPMGADQFFVARLVEAAEVGLRVCEGAAAVPEVQELARALAATVGGGEREQKVRWRAAELRRVARDAVEEGGSSFMDLGRLIAELRKMKETKKTTAAEMK